MRCSFAGQDVITGLNFPFVISSACDIFSCLMDCRDNKYWIETASILREHFICFVSVSYILRVATCQTCQAASQNSYKWYCSQPAPSSTYDCAKYFGCHYKYFFFLHRGARDVFFLSLSDFICFFYFPPSESFDTSKPCFHCQPKHCETRFLENTVS